MKYNLISSILGRPWLIHKPWADSNLPLIASIVNGGQVELPRKQRGVAFDDDDEGEQPAGGRVMIINASSGTIKPSYYRSFDEAPKGSIAVIPVVGPISKYYNCGIAGSADMVQWIKDAEASDRIEGIVLQFDTPGGMVDGTPTLSDAIAFCSKPTTGFVDDGMCASAGIWAISGCDEIVLSQPTDMLGSIGVYTTIYDFSARLEQMGIKAHEIYAPQSKLKNKDTREALAGNYKPVLEDLAFLADTFIQAVKKNRGDKLDLSHPGLFEGAVFYGDDAIKAGLADRYGAFELAVESTYNRIGAPKQSRNQSIHNMSLFGNKYPGIAATKGKKAQDITEADITAMNAELDADGVTAVRVFPSSFEANATRLMEENASVPKLKTDLKAAQDAVAKSAQELADEKAAHLATTTELNALKESTTAKGKTKPVAGEDPILDSSEKTEFFSEADAELALMRKQLGLK